MSAGALSKFGIHANNPVEVAMECKSFGVRSSREHIEANGFRGDYSRIAERVIEGPESVGGRIVMSPSPEEAALLMPWIGFSNGGSGTSYALTSLASRYLTIDRVAKVHTYSGCKVNSVAISAQKGAPWEWSIDVIGQQETEGSAGTFPSLSITETPPLALHHAVVTLLSSARSVSGLTITIDNQLQADHFNADYATLIEAQDRIVSVSLQVPYVAANTDLKHPSVGGASATVVFTYGNYACTFTFGKLQFPRGAIEVAGKSGIMLQLDGTARMTSSTRELAITLDSTP